ncbi:endonuclease/exonuclease/phosphatase family protein [Peredibacter sp. HCB2-198]|uniref:endonuclease/exonuclease/phosphatase family protein n=1 Tax=Peredibacter sp. HCB2-198 TaxID=3383025 RepID=UPI0038B68771
MKLRILSYNIHKGFTIGNRDFILEQIRLALRETNADILFLQEVLGDHQDKKCRIPDWKTAIQFEYLADTVWTHFAYGKNAVYPEGHHGNAILSKFPIMDWNNHVISTNRFEHRGLLKAKVQIPETGQEIVLANAHLNLLQGGRDLQADMIIKHMRTDEGTPWVLVGDFNDWNKKISPKIEHNLGAKEVFKFLHGKYPLTFPSFMPTLSLDRFFVHGLNPVTAMALTDSHWKNLSDHLPLYVEIDLPDA